MAQFYSISCSHLRIGTVDCILEEDVVAVTSPIGLHFCNQKWHDKRTLNKTCWGNQNATMNFNELKKFDDENTFNSQITR